MANVVDLRNRYKEPTVNVVASVDDNNKVQKYKLTFYRPGEDFLAQECHSLEYVRTVLQELPGGTRVVSEVDKERYQYTIEFVRNSFRKGFMPEEAKVIETPDGRVGLDLDGSGKADSWERILTPTEKKALNDIVKIA